MSVAYYIRQAQTQCASQKYKPQYYVRNSCKKRSKNTKREKQGNTANEKPLKTKSS